MEMEKKYCENCKQRVNYEVREKKITTQVAGQRINYKGLAVYCEKCHLEMFVSDIASENLRILNREIRIKNDIISVEELQDFIKNSNYTYDELSEILYVTTSYIELWLEKGAIPPKHVSEKIRELISKGSKKLK